MSETLHDDLLDDLCSRSLNRSTTHVLCRFENWAEIALNERRTDTGEGRRAFEKEESVFDRSDSAEGNDRDSPRISEFVSISYQLIHVDSFHLYDFLL